MSVDLATVKRVAKLARIAVTDEEAAKMEGELNTILGFVEQLNEVDVEGVGPMTSVMPMETRPTTSRPTRRRRRTISFLCRKLSNNRIFAGFS